MYKIIGKHSIRAVLNNPKRKNIVKKDDYLLVSELFIETDLDTIIKNYEKIILLDNMTDIRNIGSIIRSAAILGFAVLLRNTCTINEMTVKCASGGIDSTAICYINNTKENIKKLKKNDFWIVGLDERGTEEALNLKKIVLVIGSEGDGMSHMIAQECDVIYKLKTPGNMFTYNASVAAAIGMYYFS